jgi:hypothetical protein
MTMIKKYAVISILIVATFLFPGAASALSGDNLKPAVDKAAAYLLALEKLQKQPLSSWSYIALGGTDNKLLANTRLTESCGQQLAGLQPGDTNAYSALVLTLLAAGLSPQEYHGQNLV